MFGLNPENQVTEGHKKSAAGYGAEREVQQMSVVGHDVEKEVQQISPL